MTAPALLLCLSLLATDTTAHGAGMPGAPVAAAAMWSAPLAPLPLPLPRPRPAVRGAADSWVAEDKWKHLVTSFFITAAAAGAARAGGLSPERSLAAGVAVGAGAGVAKEVHDLRRGARPMASLRDLVWDAAGLALGAALVRQTY